MSNGPEFFQTGLGRAFYEGTLPRIAKALEAIAAGLAVRPQGVPTTGVPEKGVSHPFQGGGCFPPMPPEPEPDNTLFTGPQENYTPLAIEIDSAIAQALQPVFEKYRAQGVSARGLAYLAMQAVQDTHLSALLGLGTSAREDIHHGGE